jgi:hypothetical protein
MGHSQFAKGGNCYPPLWKRGARGDFLIKPLNISVLHRAINTICRSSIKPEWLTSTRVLVEAVEGNHPFVTSQIILNLKFHFTRTETPSFFSLVEIAQDKKEKIFHY